MSSEITDTKHFKIYVYLLLLIFIFAKAEHFAITESEMCQQENSTRGVRCQKILLVPSSLTEIVDFYITTNSSYNLVLGLDDCISTNLITEFSIADNRTIYPQITKV